MFFSRFRFISANGPIKGMILIVLATFLFSSHDVVSKHLSSIYPVALVVWARYFVHTLLMTVIFLPKAGVGVLISKSPRLQILRGFFLVSTSLFFTSSLRYIPLAESTSINFLAPLLVIVLSMPILDERVSMRQLCAVVIGFVGTLFIVRPGGDLFKPAVLLPFCSAFCFAMYQLLTRKVSSYDSATTSNFIGGLLSTLVMTALLPFFWVTPKIGDCLLMVALGTLGMLSHLLFSQSFRYAAPAVLAPFSYCQIFFSTLLGIIVFGDVPETLSIYGMAIIALSGASAIFKGRRNVEPKVVEDKI